MARRKLVTLNAPPAPSHFERVAMNPRAIKQLHVEAIPTGCYMIVLAADGTLWQFRWPDNSWVRLPDLPVAEEQP